MWREQLGDSITPGKLKRQQETTRWMCSFSRSRPLLCPVVCGAYLRLYLLLTRSFLMASGENREMQVGGALNNYSLETRNDKCALLPQCNILERTKQWGKRIEWSIANIIYSDVKYNGKFVFSLPLSLCFLFFAQPPFLSLSPCLESLSASSHP